MEFELITDVPEAIAEFYQEEVRNEATGEYTSESYEYEAYDNEGELITQTGTRQVAEYVDNTYVVMLSRPQSVSWEKVDSIIAKNQGAKDEVVNKFIDLAVATEKWEFHDSYIDWLDECAEIDTYNATEQLDEEGNAIDFEQKAYSDEPVYVSSGLGKTALISNAKYKRNTGLYENITVDGVTYDCDTRSQENMKGAVRSWETLTNDTSLIECGAVSGDTVGWTLADNTILFITKEQLEAVIDALTIRGALLQAKYTEVKASI